MRRPRQAGKNSTTETTGSPQPGEPLFLAVGFLRRPHGVKGEILMDVVTEHPERLGSNKQVYVGDEHEAFRIEKIREIDQAVLISFAGVTDPEQASLLRNKPVYAMVDALPELPEGTYYHTQLIGLGVVDGKGQPLGILTEILETGANDVYVVVSEDGAETLLPVIEGVVVGVDLEKREMRVNPPDWD
jgi:16S rRNA processing protein RimM